jgi:hypothetical protein
MKPELKKQLINKREFGQLILSSFARTIKTELDRLTIPNSEGYTGKQHYADVLLLAYLRRQAQNPSFQDPSKKGEPKPEYIYSMLELFDDNGEGIEPETDENGNVISINWDEAKPIIMTKIKEIGYFYSLAGASMEDFEKDVNGE